MNTVWDCGPVYKTKKQFQQRWAIQNNFNAGLKKIGFLILYASSYI